MGPRGRPRKRSESGTSLAETDAETSTSSSSRPRRSRLPKRYFDEDYSPPPAKRRGATNRSSPESDEHEEEVKKVVKAVTSKATTPVVSGSATKSTPKTRGRPKRAAPASTGRRKSKKVEEIVYMDEESEDAESSEDEEFMIPDEQDEIEEELELDNIKIIKEEEEEEAFCPWLEDPDTIPKLELPESSQDIPLPIHSTFDAIEIYEILRSYHRTLRITPFAFEDFCAALISKNNSCIMSEIHMALLKICLKSDDEEQTHYSITDTNNAVNIVLHHMDALTYAEVLRLYIESYPNIDVTVRDAIRSDNYPYCAYESKLIVLLFMCYRFLYSSEYRKVVNNIGKFQNDDNCRVCGKSSGRIVGCTQCEAAFHVECSNLKPFPEVLVCNICKTNNVRGVANALPFGESVDREPLRSQPIGRDRYGRYYWFVARRLIVQSLDETETHYYSTPPQLFQVLEQLDRHYYEKALCEVIQSRIDEFLEQMTLTLEMSTERRDAAIEVSMKRNSMTFEYVESITPQLYLHRDSMKRMSAILRHCAEKAKLKSEVKAEDDAENDEASRSSGPLVAKQEDDDVLPSSMIGIHEGSLINTFWSAGASQEDLVKYFTQNHEHIHAYELWRLGDETHDQTFMSYHNWYSKNDMAESTATRKKQADKKKYMASRFNIQENFEWTVAKDRQFYGNSVLHNKFVGWSMGKISRKIPADLMHRKWPEVMKAFEAELTAAENYKQLATCLLKLEAVARKTIFMPQWWSGLGQTRMERSTVDQRENFVKEQQKIKKLETDALAKDLDDSWVRVNYRSRGPNTYILRQKGETYRNASRGAMGGWMWVSNKYEKTIVPVPEIPDVPLAESEGPLDSVSTRKARRLEEVLGRIKKKKQALEKKKLQPGDAVPNIELISKCYSPTCISKKFAPSLHNSQCYSPSCRIGYYTTIRQRHEEEEANKRGKIGEEKPWPIPEVHTFSSKKDGKRNIFVLQKNSRVLRQMIVTAGRQQIYMPGFASTAKSNMMVWPYPAPRPTVDLCWKWQTVNARSLHAVALQLKILWSSIKWNEFEPEDSHPDRRVVVDTPSHDERRRIIRHKEMPPFGQYERYELEIEIIPLYEDHEEEDESWHSRNRNNDHRNTSTRKIKRPNRGPDNRMATAIRREWVDGVTLKVFEIKDYWKAVRTEVERAAKRKLDAARKAAKAREDAEKSRQQALVAKQRATQAQAALARPAVDRLNVPYVGPPAPRAGPLSQQANGNRYLEQYNTSQIPPRTGVERAMPTASQAPPQLVRHVAQNPLRKPQYAQMPVEFRNYSPQHASTSRAAAGSDGAPIYRTVVVHQSGGLNAHYAQQPIRQTTNGFQWSEGMMRGGGRMVAQHGTPRPRPVYQQPAHSQPFGEPTTAEMRRALPVAEEAVSASAVASDGDEQPPVIPRYDRNTPLSSEPLSAHPPQPRPAQVRQVYNAPGNQIIRPGAQKNLIYVKPEGPQRVVMRQTMPGQGPSQTEYPPGTVLPAGARIMTVRPQGPPQQRQIISTANGTRVVRLAHPTRQGVEQQVIRRVIPAQRQMEYADEPLVPPTRYVVQGQPAMKMPRVVPRGGMTMQMVQQQQHPEHRRLLAGGGRQKQKVTTYRDFMASRGYLDASKFMMQSKPTCLPFEFNEEEEREINEAIAREEEWMRLEEENKMSGFETTGNPLRSLNSSAEVLRAPPYVSNLLPSVNDSPDDKIIKQVLDVMFSQVCRWDRQYGWSKTHLKRARQKNDTEKIHMRKFRLNQRELLIADHMERLKKEINKRRTRMENEAEQQCGLLTPWRKARARPYRHSKPKQEVKKEVINPADITLGGDTYDYVKQEEKVTDSIASGVARRRRTSANLSKSEDDSSHPPPTTRGNKERRTSETTRSPPFFGSGANIEIDVAIAHCTCQQMYDATKFYVQCEMCARWYHGECVDVTEKKVKDLESWTCEQCIEEQERVKEHPALYCVCRKPYDDTKFYVGCDSCQGWFHPECVGITREAAEQAAEYNCPECIQAGYDSDESSNSRASSIFELTSRNDYALVLRLLELLVEHRMSTPFRNPVDLTQFPDYEQTIKKPMDLSTISQKVDRLEYQYLHQFVNDVNLMFENAKSYNPPEHAVFKCAETMQELFEKRLTDVKDEIISRQQMLQAQQEQSSSMSSARKRVQSESQRTNDSLDIDPEQLLPLDQSVLQFFNF